MKITASAPGKLMLLGEHAVVYGYPCLVASTDKKIIVEAEFAAGQDEIITPGVNDNRYVKTALFFFKKEYKLDQAVKIKTTAEFSDKLGFGSSAATTVATIRALNILFDKKMNNRQLFDLGYKICAAVQGSGSGFDVAASVYGGTLYYAKKGEIIESVTIDILPLLVIGYSGNKANTAEFVEQVAKLYQDDTDRLNRIFNKIEDIVNLGHTALIENNLVLFGELMTRNHILLKSLDVSTDKLDEMVDAALQGGAYGAKLSGAGGGDCIIALTPDDKKQAVINSITNAGGEVV